MRDPNRFLHLAFQIDANRINSRQDLHAMNQLERWREAGLIDLMISETAQKEAAAGSPSRTEKAHSYIFSMSEAAGDDTVFQRIENVLWPDGPTNQNQKNDVDIVFNASKYGRTLVTNDGASKTQPGGILGRREALAGLGVEVMTDEEAVSHVRHAIFLRDEQFRKTSALTGEPLPEWIGKDE